MAKKSPNVNKINVFSKLPVAGGLGGGGGDGGGGTGATTQSASAEQVFGPTPATVEQVEPTQAKWVNWADGVPEVTGKIGDPEETVKVLVTVVLFPSKPTTVIVTVCWPGVKLAGGVQDQLPEGSA